MTTCPDDMLKWSYKTSLNNTSNS